MLAFVLFRLLLGAEVRLRMAVPFDGQVISWDPLRTTLGVSVEIDFAAWEDEQQHPEQQQLCLAMHGMIGDVCVPHPRADGAAPLVLEHLHAGNHTLRAELRRVVTSDMASRGGDSNLGGAEVLASAEAHFAVHHDSAAEPPPSAQAAEPEWRQQRRRRPAAVMLSAVALRGAVAKRSRLAHLVCDSFDARTGAALRQREAFMAPPGGGSCALLAFLARALPRGSMGGGGGAVVVEVVGRHSRCHGASAFALGAEPSTSVVSFAAAAVLGVGGDSGGEGGGEGHNSRAAAIAALLGLSVAQLQLAAPNVAFRADSVLRQLDSVLRGAQLLFLDVVAVAGAASDGSSSGGGGAAAVAGAAVAPLLLRALVGLSGGGRRGEEGFSGVVLCDGIYATSAAARWWHAIEESSSTGVVAKYDVSPLGDGEVGTGLLDFSGLVKVVPE